MDSNTSQDYENLPGLVRRWLEKLAEIGLSEPSNPPEAAGDDTISTQLVGGRVGWLQLDAGERELGYKGARVFERPFQTDQAILSALSILEAQPVDPDGKNPKQVWKAARLRVAMRRAGLRFPEALKQPDRLKEARRNDPWLREFKIRDLKYVWRLAYHEACLRHHRSDFDTLPDDDKVALLVRACKHVDSLLEAARASQAFFEYDSPDGLPTHKGADPERDIRAAELRDVLGLEHHEIGEILGVPPPKDYDRYGDHQAVRRMVKRGRERLKNELGEEGYEQHIEAKKPDLKRWHSLGDDQGTELFAEWLAERWEILPVKALQITEEALRRAFAED